ncbi:MAG TPA: nuclear transport factor 2 family protein [Pyrinomonadaceae bacterium]|jgi:ketosteroid isomerase-like protein|nr:nuclear transport factor 2 family protein [Pyrinomonadaceae bacterium]
MSEQENTRVVQQIYESFKSGNILSILDRMSDDIEWRLPVMENVPFSGRRSGIEQVAGFFKTLSDTQDVRQFEPQEFIAQGENVVALGHYSWHAKATGRDYEGDWAHVFTIRDGKVVRFYEYTDTASAAAAHRP